MKTQFGGYCPLGRDENLYQTRVANETVIYDASTRQAMCLNEVMTVIWEACNGQRDVEMLVEIASLRGFQDVDRGFVEAALVEFEEFGLLEAAPGERAPVDVRLTRRRLLGRIGQLTAASIPVITALGIPPAIAQASGNLPNGAPCGSSLQCASGCCKAVGGGSGQCKSGGGNCLP